MKPPLAKTISTTSGVYLYKDIRGHIIYVGKARNLRKRIMSYFRGEVLLPPKTKAMLSHAHSIETISTNTEKEALLLESSLIKKHKPRYNIILRDDKQYVLFRIQKNRPFPRVEIVRKVHKDDALYFGPYTSGKAARSTWKVLHTMFPLRRCSDKVLNNRVRPCLYYHLNQCLAPCTESVDSENYAAIIQHVILFLSGRSKELVSKLRKDMSVASDALDFERAAMVRDQIKGIEKTVEKQHVVFSDGSDIDVVGIATLEHGLGIGFLFVRDGSLIDGKSFFFKGLQGEDAKELLVSALGQFYGAQTFIPSKIIVPWIPESFDDEDSYTTKDIFENMFSALKGSLVRIVLPKKTKEFMLLDMAVTNAREASLTSIKEPMASRLAEIFKFSEPIVRIECVDVSHTGGDDTRIGMVVFENEQPLKAAYRVYKYKDEKGEMLLSGGDDYAALASWMRRRLKSGPPWPDLLLIDGGRGQVSAVYKVLCEEKMHHIYRIAGIAKARTISGRADRRAGNIMDTVFVPGRKNPLPFKHGSPELLFLQHVRDTAHSYTLRNHRKAHIRSTLSSELMGIPGVGAATAKLLWEHFKTVDAMTHATPEDLQQISGIGAIKARILSEKLKKLQS